MGCIDSRETVQRPWPLSSLSREEWLKWRSLFLTFMNDKYVPPYKQLNKFLECIGFLGEEVFNKMYFQHPKEDIKLSDLLFKFDVYFLFGTVTRNYFYGTVDQYIVNLERIALEKAQNANNIPRIVKEKILQDFKSEDIFTKLKMMSSYSHIHDYDNLNQHELIFLWKECEKPIIHKKLDCLYCGRYHESKKCYAKGQKCWNCGKLHHFARCCSESFTNDCSKCGSNHILGSCPALGKKCSRCKRMNHFSWRCSSDIIASCIYCGRSHVNSRQYCSANNNRCSICNRIGHFASNCWHPRARKH